MSAPLLDVRGLTKRFAGLTANDSVSFSVNEGEIVSIIGPNGAGKSTFFKSVTGQLRGAQTSGRVLVAGEDVTQWRTHHIIRLGVGVKTQVPSVLNGLTVLENLWLAARRTLGHAEAEAVVDEVVSELRLEGLTRHRVGELAHGQRQLVEIGIVLAGKPRLVLLDEPAAGITSTEMDRLVALIKRINQTAAVIVVDHDMHFVRRLEGRITVFHQGAVLVEGAADTVLSDARVREVYLGNRAR
jgi:ABC-type uncharacterized transport system ATPase subunit